MARVTHHAMQPATVLIQKKSNDPDQRHCFYGVLHDLVLSLYRRVQKAEPYRLTGAAAPLAIQSKEHGRQPGSFIAGFVKGADAAPFAVFPAPKVPASYQPLHKFAEPLLTGTSVPPRPYMRVQHAEVCNAVDFVNLCDPANALSGVTFPSPLFCRQCLPTSRTKILSGERGAGGATSICMQTHIICCPYWFMQPGLHVHVITVTCGDLPCNTNLMYNLILQLVQELLPENISKLDQPFPLQQMQQSYAT